MSDQQVSVNTETGRTAPANDPLAPYVPTPDKPWNARRVAHLYRRLGFGASYEDIQQGLQMSPSALVDHLLNTAATLDPPPPPVWANFVQADYANNFMLMDAHRRELRRRWWGEMLNEGIRAKMALFWHNHFVTELLVFGCNSYLWSYYTLLCEFAFGNFQSFVLAMGKNPAMLVYLNGNINEAGEPNENYARELMELFTLGEGNGYTQLDVVEMSRALTGWRASFNDCTPPYFDPAKHDNGVKTILGATGNFGFDEAHNLIFTQRPEQVARFISTKLYTFFIDPEPDAPVIEGLAATFRQHNWELLPLLRQLFKSEHFFDDHVIHAKLKSPMETQITLLRTFGARTPEHIQDAWWEDVGFRIRRLGQEIFDPPNVAGWKENRAWVNESTLVSRWNYAALTADFLSQTDTMREKLRTLAKTLTNNSKDPAVITAALVEHFLGQNLGPVYAQAAVLYFKEGIPDNYFTDGTWNLDWAEAPDQIVNLVKYLVRLPEYQLN